MSKEQTFDQKNKKWYVLSLHLIAFSHAAVSLLALFGHTPKFSIEDKRTAFFYFISAVVAAFLAWLVSSKEVRGSYCVCIVAITSATCALVSGAPLKSSLATIVVALLFALILFISGDKGNKNSPMRTIKIKIPWM